MEGTIEKKAPRALFSTAQWITWTGALVGAVAILMLTAFTTFETKDHAAENKKDFQDWMTRVEGKLDKVLEN